MKNILLIFCLIFPVFVGAQSQRSNFTEYQAGVTRLSAACKAKGEQNFSGFCISKNYEERTQRSITVGLMLASFGQFYKVCEHAEFPTLNTLLARAEKIDDAKVFLDEMTPQKEALQNYASQFDYCRTKDENNAQVLKKIQWFEYMVDKFGAVAQVKDALGKNSSPATEMSLPKSIWLVKQLSCNGIVAHQMARSPDAAEIGRTGIVKIPNLQMEFIVPSIPELAVRSVKLAFDDRGRSVVDHYVLLSPNDLDDPVAAVMVTELPPAVDTPQKALGSAVAGERENLKGTSAQPTLERISTSWGEGLDIFVPNRIGSPCFPAARFKLTADSETKPTISLSRFVTVPGRLIQFALILPVTPGTPLEAQKANARRVMEIYAAGLRVQ